MEAPASQDNPETEDKRWKEAWLLTSMTRVVAVAIATL